MSLRSSLDTCKMKTKTGAAVLLTFGIVRKGKTKTKNLYSHSSSSVRLSACQHAHIDNATILTQVDYNVFQFTDVPKYYLNGQI